MKSLQSFFLICTLTFSFSSFAFVNVGGGGVNPGDPVDPGGGDWGGQGGAGGIGGAGGAGGGPGGGAGGNIGGVGTGVGTVDPGGYVPIALPGAPAQYGVTDIRIENGLCKIKNGPSGQIAGSPCAKLYTIGPAVYGSSGTGVGVGTVGVGTVGVGFVGAGIGKGTSTK